MEYITLLTLLNAFHLGILFAKKKIFLDFVFFVIIFLVFLIDLFLKASASCQM